MARSAATKQKKAVKGRMTVSLTSVGNPDHGQDHDAPVYGVEDTTAEVDSLAHASAVCRAWILKNDLGGGNWSGGRVSVDGKVVARISYNGRVWATDGSEVRS